MFAILTISKTFQAYHTAHADAIEAVKEPIYGILRPLSLFFHCLIFSNFIHHLSKQSIKDGVLRRP